MQEKIFDKNPNPFMTESLSNNVEGNFLNLKKGKHETPKLMSYLTVNG